jgi:hypothetical protein
MKFLCLDLENIKVYVYYMQLIEIFYFLEGS